VKKGGTECLSFLGGKTQFSTPLQVGQMNLPKWEHFENAFRDIFTRRYYTNHGPLTQELENRLAEFFGVRHVVTVTNGTIALMLAAKALNLTGKIILPAFTFPATVQSLTWAKIEPLFCDVDPLTHMLTPELVAPLLNEQDVSAVLPVHLWGNLCNTEVIEDLAQEKGIPVYYDASHAFGCTHKGRRAGSNGILECFSFHSTNVFNTAEGGCVCVDDDEIAERLRNLRSSYGRRKSLEISINANGRFSEAQAAMGLLNLKDYSSAVASNKAKFELYIELLGNIPGIRILQPVSGEECNYQHVVLEIDDQTFGLTRDQLIRLLEAENIFAQRSFAPGIHRCSPYKEHYPHFIDALPITDMLCERVMQLSSGHKVSLQDVRVICEIIILIYNNADFLRDRLTENS
jgi:dTDP-4-amino-4,6-dideoxygalactose transaminase